jgi:hypothetical protein
MQALHLSCVCALCVKARVWTMEYNCISRLVNIFKSLKCLILCFMSSQTKLNTAYICADCADRIVIFSSLLRLIIGR